MVTNLDACTDAVLEALALLSEQLATEHCKNGGHRDSDTAGKIRLLKTEEEGR